MHLSMAGLEKTVAQGRFFEYIRTRVQRGQLLPWLQEIIVDGNFSLTSGFVGAAKLLQRAKLPTPPSAFA